MKGRPTRGGRAAGVAVLAAGGAVATAAGVAAVRAADAPPRPCYVSIPAYAAPGTPEPFNRIAYVEHRAPARAGSAPSAVLILVPGYMGGAEDFRYVGERLVARLPRVEVWAVDRRNNFLENRSGMDAARAARDPRVAAAYYLEGKALPGCPEPGSPGYALTQTRAAAAGMRDWGLKTSLEDVRCLVAYARARYPRAKVFLGGHSLGGMTAQLYAGWRFGESPGTAGWRTIDGIALIDGAVDGPNWESVLIGQYLRDKKMLEAGRVYWDDPSVGASPLVGQLAEICAMDASLNPKRESFLWRAMPAGFRWPDPRTAPTAKALFAAFSDDRFGSVPNFLLHQGDVDAPFDGDGDGEPDRAAPPDQDRLLAHWKDFDRAAELSDTGTWARALWEYPFTNGFEWYFSVRLNADVDLASNLDSRAAFFDPVAGVTTSARERSGHRVFDTARVAVPVYAFVASEGRPRFDWYRRVARSVPRFTLVDHSRPRAGLPAYAHLDPLFAADTGGRANPMIASLAECSRRRRARGRRAAGVDRALHGDLKRCGRTGRGRRMWVQVARAQREMADEPRDADYPRSGQQGVLLLHSVLTGLTPLIPVPFVDDLAKSHFRRRLFRLLGEARGAGLGQETVDALARETSVGCLGGCLSQVLLYPLKKIFRKVFFFLEWKRAVDLTSHTYHFGYLVDYALQEGLLAPGTDTGRVGEIRTAIERTCREAPIRPVERAVAATFRQSHSAILSAATAVGARLRGAGPRTSERAVAEAAEPAATPQASTVAASLGERVGNIPEEHFRQLQSRFLAHLANPGGGIR